MEAFRSIVETRKKKNKEKKPKDLIKVSLFYCNSSHLGFAVNELKCS